MAISGAFDAVSYSSPVVVANEGADGVRIEDPQLMFSGDYFRLGDDLLIAHGGESVLVQEYFGGETPQNLVAPNGAFLSGDVVSALAGPSSPGQYAQAGPAAGSLEIGKIIKLAGAATAKHASGIQVDLAEGDPVFQGDVVETGPGSTLGISFVDKTVFSMSADARMVLDELIYNPGDAANSSMVINLVQGAFVFVTGEIAPSGNMKIDTPVATMGIRGTTPKVVVNTNLGIAEFTILPDPGSDKIGSYFLLNKVTGEILAKVESVGDKWVVTTLTNEAIKIGKSGLDLLEDQVALDEIRDAVSRALGDRAEIDGSNSYTQVSFDSSASGDNSGGGQGGGDGGSGTDTPGGGNPLGDKDDPPIAGDDAFATNEDLVLTGGVNVINASGGGGDVDPDGFALHVTQVNGANLNFAAGPASVLLPSGAILLIDTNGNITYDPNDAYDFLGLNDVDTDGFTYTVEDPNAFSDTATVTITLTGRNDQPEITHIATTKHADGFTEQDDTTGDTATIRTALGAVTFADIDASDIHTPATGAQTVTWTQDGGAEIALGPIGSIALSLTETAADAGPVLQFAANGALLSRPAPVEGQVQWTYTVADNELDFLGEGETLEIVIPVTITDDSGVGAGGGTNETDSVTQNVTITITGTNDVPVISAGVVSGTINDIGEAPDAPPPTNAGDQTVTGSITFADVDLTDTPDASEAVFSITATAQGGGPLALSPAQIAAIDAAFSIVNAGTNTNDGTVTWNYTIAESLIDFLGAGEIVTAVFTITVTDDEGATDTQNVTITIVGAGGPGGNDAPVVSAVDIDGAMTEGSGDLSEAGSVTFADVDLTDRPVASEAAFSITATAQGGGPLALSEAQITALDAAFSIVNVAGNTNDGTVNWTYSIAEGALDFLGEGEVVTTIFTITVTDDEGATDTQNVTVTITGTNDTPVVSAVDIDGAMTEGSGDLSEAGSVTFADVDLTDRPVASEAKNSITAMAQDGVTPLALSEAQITALDAAFSIVNVAGNTNDGTVNWTYSIAEGALDFLGEGEVVTAVFTITVTDDEGATDTQNVTVTITGTNDTPVVSAVDIDGAMTEGSGDLSEAGSVTFADVDLTDRPVASEAKNSITAMAQDGVTPLALSEAQITALDAAFSIVNVAGNTNDGTVNWTYSIAEGALDFLGEGEVVTAVFTITVTDDEGATDTQDVTVTITGTNDTPVIAIVEVSGAITEGSVDLSETGSVTFADVDLTDRPVASEAKNSITAMAQDGVTPLALSEAQITALDAAFSIVNVAGNTNDGTVNWTYSIAEGALDFLGEGEVVTAVFTITVTDDEGATDTQDVTVTITGTNDTPVIAIVEVSGAITEGSVDLSETGSVTFADVDLTDRPVASEAKNSITAMAQDGVTPLALSEAQITALDAAFSIVNVAGNTNDGTVNWTYSIAEGALDFLGEGEVVTAVFTITVTDDEGATDTQNVTVTITGTNDTPVVSAVDIDGAMTEGSGDLSEAGSVTFADVDLTDRPVASEAKNSITAMAQDGVTPLALSEAQITALDAAFSIVNVAGNTNDGTVNWTYSIAEGALDFLGEGEVVTAVFTITVTDDEGATDTQDVTVTITGTNDTPVVAVLDVTGEITELVTPVGNLTETGTIAFSDVDLTDAHGIDPVIVASAGALGSLTAGVTTDTTGSGLGGVITWNYSVPALAVEYLAKDQTKVETFTVTLDDGNGGTVDRAISVTITGTNDTPVLETSVRGGVVEDDDPLTLSVSGELSFSDVDTIDTHTVAASYNNDAVWLGGTLTLAEIAALTAGFTADEDSWDFTVANADVQFLASGETVIFSYNVTVTDNSGAANDSDAKTVTITITGANDAPVVSAVTNPEAVLEGNTGFANVATFDLATAFTATDADINDVPLINEATISIAANPLSATNLTALLTVSGSSVSYDTAGFDFLDTGESAIYDVTFDVVSGADVVSRTVTITINGQNETIFHSLSSGSLLLDDTRGSIDTLGVSFDPVAQDITLAPHASGVGFVIGDGVNTLTVADMDLNTVDILGIDLTEFDDTFVISGDFTNEGDSPAFLGVGGGDGADIIDASGAVGFGNNTAIIYEGNAGNDEILGSDGTETIRGGADNDTIDGGGGFDHIDGGAGVDTLTGGAGPDVFAFADLPDIDTILDFAVLEDTIDLHALLSAAFNPLDPGAEIAIVDNGAGGSDLLVSSNFLISSNTVAHLDGVNSTDTINIIYNADGDSIQFLMVA